jgi:hypothetical protein
VVQDGHGSGVTGSVVGEDNGAGVVGAITSDGRMCEGRGDVVDPVSVSLDEDSLEDPSVVAAGAA